MWVLQAPPSGAGRSALPDGTRAVSGLSLDYFTGRFVCTSSPRWKLGESRAEAGLAWGPCFLPAVAWSVTFYSVAPCPFRFRF